MMRSRSKKNNRRMPPEVYETVMHTRARGECEGRITPKCTRFAQEWHHRQRRNVGPDTVSNGLALCKVCHMYVTDTSPKHGRDLGIVVSSYAPDPAAVPVMWRGKWWLLEEDGARTPYQKTE